jgi:hypothetical protein
VAIFSKYHLERIATQEFDRQSVSNNTFGLIYIMDTTFSSLDALSSAHDSPIFQLTVSPAETTLQFQEETPKGEAEEPKPEVKKPAKKRKSWGQELPIPKTNLPPRYLPFRTKSSRRSEFG